MGTTYNSKAGVNPSVQYSQQGMMELNTQTIPLVSSVHASKQGMIGEVYDSHAGLLGPSVHSSQSGIVPSNQVTQIEKVKSINACQQGVVVPVNTSQSGLPISFHEPKNEIVGPIQGISQQNSTTSVKMLQGVESIKSSQAGEINSYAKTVNNVGLSVNSSKTNKARKPKIADTIVELHNSHQGSMIGGEMGSFPVGSVSKPSDQSLVPNPFENQFSTLKGDQPSNSMNFPDPFYSQTPGLSKSNKQY